MRRAVEGSPAAAAVDVPEPDGKLVAAVARRATTLGAVGAASFWASIMRGRARWRSRRSIMGARRVGCPDWEMARHAGRRLLLQCPSRIAYCGSMMRRYLSAYRRGSVITGRFSAHGALKSGQVGVRLVATR